VTITYGTPALILIGTIAAIVIVVSAGFIISDARANRRERAQRNREAK
jgi:hypothetical protein